LELKQKAGEYSVEIKIDKYPPSVGTTDMTIEVKNAAGNHVTDAVVKVDYSMPAMPGMPAMNYKTDAALAGKVYKAKMKFSMSGPWNIAVKIMRAGKTASVKFSVDVQ
jgi:hypothetical protein